MSRLFTYIVTLVQHFDILPPKDTELLSGDPNRYSSGAVLQVEDYTLRVERKTWLCYRYELKYIQILYKICQNYHDCISRHTGNEHSFWFCFSIFSKLTRNVFYAFRNILKTTYLNAWGLKSLENFFASLIERKMFLNEVEGIKLCLYYNKYDRSNMELLFNHLTYLMLK
jgi:hypothetical protein